MNLKTLFAKIDLKTLAISIAIPLIVGLLASLLTMDSRTIYASLVKPPLAPPGWVFPVVWTVLYVLMGVSFYLVLKTPSNELLEAIGIYALQLFLNFIWTIAFFHIQDYRLAFGILVALWISILLMIIQFAAISPLAGKLQIPYLLWVTFAGYLNLMIALLNP